MLASRVQGTRMCEEEKTQCVFVSKVISYVWFYFFLKKAQVVFQVSFS